MVKLLSSLKVAEIRIILAEKGESAVGKKPELVQRLSDWLEDNGHDPDKFDFEISAPTENPEPVSDPIPPLEPVKSPEVTPKSPEKKKEPDVRTTDEDELLATSGTEKVENEEIQKDILDELDYTEDEPVEVFSIPSFDPKDKHVWIKGLKRGTSANQIKEDLVTLVQVTSGKVVERKNNSGKIEVYGFITLESAKDAANVKELFDGKTLCGESVSVEIVQTDPTAKRKSLTPMRTGNEKRAKVTSLPVVDLTEEDEECELENEIKRLDREITDLKRTFDQTGSNNKATIRENGRNQNEMARLRSTADAVKRDVTRLRTDRAKVQNELGKLKSDMEHERASLRAEQSALTKLRKERTEITKTKQKLVKDRDRLKREINQKSNSRPMETFSRGGPEVVRPFQEPPSRPFIEPMERQMDSSRVTVTYGDTGSYTRPHPQPSNIPKRTSGVGQGKYNTGLVPNRAALGTGGNAGNNRTMPSRHRPQY